MNVYEALIAEGERSAAFRKTAAGAGKRVGAEAQEECFARQCRRR